MGEGAAGRGVGPAAANCPPCPPDYNATTLMGATVNLTHHFLIAMPSMADPNFAHTLTYVCEHNPDGALGLVVNRPIDMTLSALFEQIEVPLADNRLREAPVMFGGPVQVDRGFVLHRPLGNWQSTLAISDELGLTTSKDILEAVGRGEGPESMLVSLGYAGWSAGQLEQELAANAWLTVEADPEVLFGVPAEDGCPRPCACSASTSRSSPTGPGTHDRRGTGRSHPTRVDGSASRAARRRGERAATPRRSPCSPSTSEPGGSASPWATRWCAARMRWRPSTRNAATSASPPSRAWSREWQPELLVVGLPVHADGSEHEMTARARRFARQLEGRFRLPVAFADERYTTEEAGRRLAESGARPPRPRRARRARRATDPARMVR